MNAPVPPPPPDPARPPAAVAPPSSAAPVAEPAGDPVAPDAGPAPLSPAARRRREWLALGLAAAVGWGLSQLMVGRQSEAARAELAARARPGEILMFSATWCGVCQEAHRWFRAEGVPYLSCEVDLDPACRERWQALGGGGTPLFVVNGRTVLGFRPAELLAALPPR